MTNFIKPKRTTLSSQIIEQMERCIEDGIWTIGSKIPSEMELMATFSVSRNTVREAILALVYADILRSIPGDGTYVLNNHRLSAVLQQRMKRARLSEILETRMILETNIVRLACRRSTPSDMEQLKQKKEIRENSELDEQQFIKADQEFHLQIAAQSHNQLLCELYSSFLAAFDEELLTAYLSKSNSNRQHKEHSILYDTIASRNEPQAIEVLTNIVEQEKRLLLGQKYSRDSAF